jgi:hypothetical protein
MRKIAMAMIVSGAALAGTGAKAAPLAGPAPLLAAPHVQTVEWGGRGEHELREHEGREGDWRRHEAWERERRHEAWERSRWHEGWERPRYSGYGRVYP